MSLSAPAGSTSWSTPAPRTTSLSVGDRLNKALGTLEEENVALQGVVQHIDFTRIYAREYVESDGTLTRFDRVLTNPPFSQNYHREGMQHREERFGFGWAPETGKKADLMFAQHVLAVLEDDGLGAIVMPHGVLFRGGQTSMALREAPRTSPDRHATATA
jgi:type I restriction enzyme M protein